MKASAHIEFYNRYTKKTEIEKVYGDKAVRWLYESQSGQSFLKLLCQRPISQFYGHLQSSFLSKYKVPKFIKEFHINIDEYEHEQGFQSFNDFFIRKFKVGARNFTSNEKQMGAFAEGRYFGYEEIGEDIVYPVKGKYLSADFLIGDTKWAPFFQEGPMLISRLCPVDYHRFHFPDDGKLTFQKHIDGILHSVNPLALKKWPTIFGVNDRHLSILETKNFGKLAFIEVGATCVGMIVQTFTPDSHPATFKKGAEKGYFLFGGSTVVVIGEKGKWKPSDDILKNTPLGKETYIHLGDEVALKN